MNKFKVRKSVFNITNICNYNCNNCYSFNNYTFSGKQTWNDYSEIYYKWSTIFDFDFWELTGGEPLTNEDWLEWAHGIHKLWPNSEGHIMTNGSLFKENNSKLQDLYKLMKHSNGKIILRISPHNTHDLEEMLVFIKEFLGISWTPHGLKEFESNFVRSYINIKSTAWPNINSIDEWYLLPEYIKVECETVYQLTPNKSKEFQLRSYLNQINNSNLNGTISFENNDLVKIILTIDTQFYPSAIKYNKLANAYELHDSDPVISHKNCRDVYCKKNTDLIVCINGKLYKCHTSKLLQDFIVHRNVLLSDHDKNIINNYIPASIDMNLDDLNKWFSNLPHNIDTCKFCPETYDYSVRVKTFSSQKKLLIKNKSTH